MDFANLFAWARNAAQRESARLAALAEYRRIRRENEGV